MWDYCMGKIVIYVTETQLYMHNFYNFKAIWINACETIKWTEILLPVCEYHYAICNLKHGPTFIVMCPCGTIAWIDRSYVPYMDDYSKVNTQVYVTVNLYICYYTHEVPQVAQK